MDIRQSFRQMGLPDPEQYANKTIRNLQLHTFQRDKRMIFSVSLVPMISILIIVLMTLNQSYPSQVIFDRTRKSHFCSLQGLLMISHDLFKKKR